MISPFTIQQTTPPEGKELAFGQNGRTTGLISKQSILPKVVAYESKESGVVSRFETSRARRLGKGNKRDENGEDLILHVLK